MSKSQYKKQAQSQTNESDLPVHKAKIASLQLLFILCLTVWGAAVRSESQRSFRHVSHCEPFPDAISASGNAVHGEV